jgi:hypothetical protein
MKRSTGTPVNLLPLLDVLLCTMGTLIVVLGVLNRLARTRTDSEQREAATIAREQITLQIEQLTTAREKTLADLETERRRLAGIEDHRRRLTDRLKDLTAMAASVTADPSVADRREALKSEIVRLRAEWSQLEKNLRAARDAAGQKKLVFSIVPFDGIFHTNRRPIYIECRGDAVILQPEGIVFTPTDFMGPGGPGNPLASALRSAQEYWRQIPPPAPDIPNEPYPLLVVRPDGIIAYYLVRDAMASWNAEFGYELVTSDAKLDFPQPPEPRLAEMEKQAVADARQRLEWLAQVSPETFDRKQKTQYRVSAIRGGLVREGGPALGNDPFANDSLGGFGRSGAVGAGGGNAGTAGDTSASAGSATNGLVDVRGNSAFGDGRLGGPALGQGGSGSGGLYGGGTMGGSPLGDGAGNSRGAMNATGSGIGGSGMPGDGLGLNNGGSGGNSPGDANGGVRWSGNANGATADGGSNPGTAGSQMTMGTTGPSLGETGSFAGNENGGRGAASGARAGSTQNQSGNRTGTNGLGEYRGGTMTASDGSSQYGGTILPGSSNAWSGAASGRSSGSPGGATAGSGSFAESSASIGSPGGNGGALSSSSSASAAGSPSMGSSGDSSQMSMGAPTPSLNFNANDQSPSRARKLANERGRNWALSNNTMSSVAITRPIRVECWSDRLVMLPDVRDQQAQVIPLADRTDEAVDQLVAAVRSHTQAWGLAGKSMYWKPQLMLDVKPDAQSRAADLQVLMADSGLDVKRK